MSYQIADPNSHLILTGAGIENIRVVKRAWVWPFQKWAKISITPFDLSMNLQVMTVEKLMLGLPAVFTIGPHDDQASITRYATLLTGESDGTPVATKDTVVTGRSHVLNLVRGVVEGEMRTIVANMTMEELFNNRKLFKDNVVANVQKELDRFGLVIYNANVKELQDAPGNEYFSSLSRKAHEGAINQAKIDTAEQRARGTIGEAEKQGKAKQEIAKINAATAILETERKAEKATADAKLKTKEISIERELELERINARRTAEARDAEMQKNVELKRAEMELERLRASTVTEAKIARESAAEKAEADLYKEQRDADGKRYKEEAEAQAHFVRNERETKAIVYRQVEEATAVLETKTKEANARYLAMKAEADGIREMASAYKDLSISLGGPQGLLQYLMLKEGTYEKLALANAKAINGLQPKITVWNTGAGEGQSGDSGAAIRNLFQALPPLFGTINEQTGMKPPSWMWDMGNQANGEANTALNEKREGAAELAQSTAHTDRALSPKDFKNPFYRADVGHTRAEADAPDAYEESDGLSYLQVRNARPYCLISYVSKGVRTRRKKCDEERPACRNCISTDRVCDGYPKASEAEASSKHQSIHTCPTSLDPAPFRLRSRSVQHTEDATLHLPRSPPLRLLADEQSYHHFDFFCQKTMLHFSSYYDTSFWSSCLLQRFVGHPTVRQAIVALGAIHRACSAASPSEAARSLAFAESSYLRALRLLQQSLSERDALDVYMVVSEVLAAFEVFRGNDEEAMSHVTHGLKVVFCQRPRRVVFGSKSPSPILTLQEVQDFVRDVEGLVIDVFRTTPKMADRQVPSHFENLDTAFGSLYSQVHYLFDALDNFDCFSAPVDHQSHAESLMNWIESFLNSSSKVQPRSALQERQGRYLKVYREAAYLLLLTYACKKTLWDGFRRSRCELQLEAQFAKLNAVVEKLRVQPNSLTHLSQAKMHQFSFKYGLVRPISPTPTADFSVHSAHDVAQKLVTMQGEAARTCNLAFDKAIWIDVATSIEDGTMTVRYFAPDSSGASSWMEERMDTV